MRNNPGSNRAVVRNNLSDFIVPVTPAPQQSPSHQNGRTHQNPPLQLNLLEPDAVTIPIPPCPNCGATEAVKTPGAGPHHAALRCASCARFLRWLPRPRLGGAV
ncbi:hypothetical protein [Gloeocapsopsis dulcis]|uniref:hypothetical protein n=1 Tax=Gloeocapsopsis dulcis TaxID=2859516 RepID=UPI0012DAA278|nr:hypothetical protein [Gloeocapsopsis dulcis]WNN92092.1 hypothetical protein P0S91_25445 [Gloeocapsopsis dulcis]